VSTTRDPDQLSPDTGRRLPRALPAIMLVACLVVSLGGLALLDRFSIALGVFLGVVVYAVAMTVTSVAVEGTRKATDRFMTTLVYCAFGLALIPLLSVSYTVVSNGLERF